MSRIDDVGALIDESGDGIDRAFDAMLQNEAVAWIIRKQVQHLDYSEERTTKLIALMLQALLVEQRARLMQRFIHQPLPLPL